MYFVFKKKDYKNTCESLGDIIKCSKCLPICKISKTPEELLNKMLCNYKKSNNCNEDTPGIGSSHNLNDCHVMR